MGVIDLSLESSDLLTDGHVIEAIAKSPYDPTTHRYLLFRQAGADWYSYKERQEGRKSIDKNFSFGSRA